jgi:quinolinate synthase
MKKESPLKLFIPAPGENDSCDCNDCKYMKLNSLEKIYNCLLNESNQIFVETEIAKKALLPIQRMLEISKFKKND